MNILGAHIDSPRLDLKQNPLYEDSGFAYFDTHYYGGIKKYQWVTIPLGIHGVIVRKDGTKEVVSIGEKEEDPVFAVTDLLVHLSSKQMEKKASAVVEGENLDILIGSRPLAGEEKEAVAAQIMKLLADTYHIEREDLMSSGTGGCSGRKGKRLWTGPQYGDGVWAGRSYLRVYVSCGDAGCRDGESDLLLYSG